MDKGWFDRSNHDEELPREEINRAIRAGIEDGRKMRRKRKVKTGLRLSAWTMGTAASLVLCSGFFFSPVNTVLAEAPLIGSLYKSFNFEIGKELAASNLVTEINQKATSNGVDVTLTSVYYDGVVIGVTFKAEGEDLSLEQMDKEHSPEAGYALGGSDTEQLGGRRGELKKMKDGSYVAAMEFEMREQELPKNYTLPLTFISMADKKGTWKFDVPVTQLPVEEIVSGAKGSTADGKHTLVINSVTKGKATSLLDITAVHPREGIQDSTNLKVVDDKGRPISISASSVFQVKTTEANVTKEVRYQVGKVSKDAKYLMIYPEVNEGEKDAIEPLVQTMPFEIASKRFDYKIAVDKVSQKEDTVVVDYYIQNVKMKQDYLNNFADMITLIRSEDVIESEDMQEQYEALKEDSLIYGKKGKLLDEETLHFQSSFEIEDAKNFDLKDYSLMVPFEIFSLKTSIKMEPIKVMLK
jgi:hypothetical protein